MRTISDRQADGTDHFKALLEIFSGLLRRSGLEVPPYRGNAPASFLGLSDDNKRFALANFQRYIHVCEQVIATGTPLSQDGSFLWRMFRTLGVHPSSDFMTSLKEGEVIEIYNQEFVQIFRNLSFFAHCSYTLDELLCKPFWELFRRDESVTAKLVQVGSAMFQQELKETHHWKIGMHTVDEIDSPALYHSVVENKILSPLFDASGRVVAAVNTIRSLSCVPKVATKVNALGTNDSERIWPKRV